MTKQWAYSCAIPLAKELSVNKNTKEFYEFYTTKLIEPKKLKGKNVLIIEIGNKKYIDEIKKYAKNVCIIDSGYNCFFGDVFENINTLKNQIKSFLEKNKILFIWYLLPQHSSPVFFDIYFLDVSS